eukprot:TRINITY_DN1865_c0_g1_i1.p1 TRINITY_DN1865_c0_g1~~TRINITY_DN1865_c0_g1_i1.p1  ORF type:complete len:662 (-),score=85.52 TRINITY_DN1865_c0_g1_i1:376-2307(-)
MADLLIAPVGEPIVLGPVRSGIATQKPSSCKDVVPWSSSSPGSHEPEHYYLHPAARVQCGREAGALPVSFADFDESRSSSMGPFWSSSSTSVPLIQLVDDDDMDDHCPVVAWQDTTADHELEIEFPNDAPSEEQLSLSDGHRWIVVYVCGAGTLSVGSQLTHRPSDVWTCFGNVMLAKRGQQIMLCRCAAYPQMINVQCASNGRDVVIHDCRCSSEEWYMHISHEQVCMDSLAGFLLFMLTAASQLLAQFGIAECIPSATSSSVPSWQTSCSQTDQWVSQSGARMWDVVFNGKCFTESRSEGGSCLIGDTSASYTGKSTDDVGVTMSALCDGDMSSQPLRSSDASSTRVPVQLALMDSEPDEESAVIEDVGMTSGAKKMSSTRCDHRTEKAVSETQTALAEHLKPAEPQMPMDIQLSDAKPPTAPRKPTSKRTSSRPRPQPGSTVQAQENQCQSFRMDAGERCASRKRESSLARHYDALHADAWKRCNETSAMQSKSFESDVRSSLDVCKAPADLPPVKGKTCRQPASRLYARHRASMEAASAMACEADQVNTCTRPSPTSKHPKKNEFRPASPKHLGVPPASAMAIDLDAGISKSFPTAEFAGTHCLKPFAISSAKLPSLAHQKSSPAAAWSVPMATPFNVF